MNLHSSMDRFEDSIIKFFVCIFFNLHSSMDRFEEGSETNLTAREIIYIPVWIDLKRQKFRKYLRG